MKVRQLIPGDVILDPTGGPSATFVAQTRHPLWTHLQLVVWRKGPDWYLDALDAHQDVGDPEPMDLVSRLEALRFALLGDERSRT
ncbi:MAG TPA: hypothetical protein VM754_00185 [Actinomycetota bacterium]|nr:hypothetical protein [Actinomycetota bacterium]